MECTEPLCAGTGKCLDQHHVNKRAALSLDPEGIRAWLADQELNSNFGGTCEHDHDTLYTLVEKLLAETERLNDMVPGRWFRVRKPDGSLWCETSDGEEARETSKETGWPLERLFVSQRSEWRPA